jgi:hypothetical protein
MYSLNILDYYTLSDVVDMVIQQSTGRKINFLYDNLFIILYGERYVTDIRSTISASRESKILYFYKA